MERVFLTGFPGFLGSELLPRLLKGDPARTAVCLVQPRWAEAARKRREQILLARPDLEGRIGLVEGDVALPDLGLGDSTALRRRVTEVHHLAAVYDLALDRETGVRVNLDGTRHVLDFCDGCPHLARLHYASTCYVSGDHAGVFSEDDLDVGQGFHNQYEATKFAAEVAVRDRMRATGLPATIYRPAIVVGDHRTGATEKLDGPYFLIRWLLRQPGVALLPVVGDPARSRLNVVPRDFVVDAIAHLASLPHSVGRTYQLADPRPPTVGRVVEALAEAVPRRVVRVRLPSALARAALSLPGARRLTGMPPQVVDYFTHPGFYTTWRAETDLEGSGIRVPPFLSYLPRLVGFVQEHRRLGSAPMA